MSVVIRATSHDIAEVARKVRELGDDRTIVNEMAKEMRRGVPPARKAARAHALAILPERGGLNEWIAEAKVRAAIRRGPRTADVKLVATRKSTKNRAELRQLDVAGTLRHPLYGNRRHWYPQTVEAGWFSDGVLSELDAFHDAITAAVNNAREKVGL